MPQVIGTITQAQPRMIERRDGTGSFPLYEVWIDGQGPFVARKDVFNQAQGLLGQRAEAVTRSEQKGEWLNHYLDFVGPADGSFMPQQNPAQQAQYAQTQTQQQPGPASQPTTAAQVMQQPNPVEERTRLSIERQKATDIAATIANLTGNVSPLIYWENVQTLVRFYATGEAPTTFAELPAAEPRQNAEAYRPYQREDFPGGSSVQQQTQNQFVPPGAYSEPEGPPPHTDDDIPF